MKKRMIVWLTLLVMLLNVCPALAQGTWYCPNCSRLNDGNFCPEDRTENPARKETTANAWELKTGDIVEFGTYLYDTSGENRSIQWYVLEVEQGKVLLLSRCGLWADFYLEGWNQPDWITWQNSGANTYMDVFLNRAFTDQEYSALVPKTIDGVKLRAFLLSYEEIRQYCTPEMKVCEPTPQTYKDGATIGIDRSGDPRPAENCYWWIRYSSNVPVSEMGDPTCP